MPSMKTRSVYRINQLLMAVKLKLTKKNDEAIPASGNVALGNDILNLLWNYLKPLLVLSILIRLYFELELLIDFLLAYKTSNFRSKSFFINQAQIPI